MESQEVEFSTQCITDDEKEVSVFMHPLGLVTFDRVRVDSDFLISPQLSQCADSD